MVCDFRLIGNQTPVQRKTQIEEALERLEKALAIGEVKVVIGPSGGVAFKGNWQKQGDGISDTCAYRKLLAKGSPELRKAVMKAEAMAGTKVNPQAVASGEHMHGDKWHKGH